MIWEHFASVLRRDSKRAVPITKLSAESVYLNNFSKMRVNLAVHTLYPIVAQEMLEHENTATSSTQTYILKCSRLFQILNSEDPIKVIEDPRIKELEDINNWFKIWQNTVKTQYPTLFRSKYCFDHIVKLWAHDCRYKVLSGVKTRTRQCLDLNVAV
jgi:hypothetical protein